MERRKEKEVKNGWKKERSKERWKIEDAQKQIKGRKQ